jgi:SAM-dependent methyltransferase
MSAEVRMSLMAAGALGAATAAAREHGLLHALAERPAGAAELASRLGLDARATEVVLGVLLAHGLVEAEGDRFLLPSVVQAELRGPAGHPTRDTELWSMAPSFLRDGRTMASQDPAVRDRAYRDVVPRLAALFEVPARRLAEALAPGLPADAHVLDVGAGSGVWSLALAQARAHVRVTGLDLPGTAERFAERAAALGLADRASTLPGDFNAITAPAGTCAAVLFANVLHLEPPDRARALLLRHAVALAPGGCIVIVDALPAEDQAASFLSAYGMHLAMRLPGARPHAPADLRAWLAEAGYARVDHRVLDDTGLVGALVAYA